MYSFKISKRYGELYKIELYFYSLVSGETQSWNLGVNPVLLRTDASARIIAKMLCNDCTLENAKHTLMLGNTPVLVGSRFTLEKLLHYWGEQNISTNMEIKISDDVILPSDIVNSEYMDKVLSEML